MAVTASFVPFLRLTVAGPRHAAAGRASACVRAWARRGRSLPLRSAPLSMPSRPHRLACFAGGTHDMIGAEKNKQIGSEERLASLVASCFAILDC
jgi:hypothetical protein